MKMKMFTNTMSLKITKILFIQGFLLSHLYNQQYAEGNVLFLWDLIYERRISSANISTSRELPCGEETKEQ